MESYELGDRILSKHMQVTRASFYAGRGPCRSDLNARMLFGIFKDLYEESREYGENFIRLVDSIPSIGATEFIVAYNEFARNGFAFKGEEADSQYAIEGRTDKEKMQEATCYALGALGIFSVNRSAEEAERVSDSIKEGFYNYTRKYYEDDFGKCLYHADEKIISDDVHRLIDPHYRMICEWNEEDERMRKRYEAREKELSRRRVNKTR